MEAITFMSAPRYGRELRAGLLALAPDVGLELLAELLQEGQGWHGRAFAERADGVAHDAVGDVVQLVELLERRPALEQLGGDQVQPGAALAARRALTARLVAVE